MVPWQLLAILSPLLYGIANVVDKFLLEKKIGNYYTYAALAGFLTLIAAGIGWLIVGWPTAPQKAILIGLLASIPYAFVIFSYFHLIQNNEVSRVSGMTYLYPAFVALLSFMFLGESIGPVKYLAIGLTITGTIILGREHTSNGNGHMLLIIPLFTLGIATVDVSYKYILGFMSYGQAYVLVNLPLSLLLMLPLAWKKVRNDMNHTIKFSPIIISLFLLTLIAHFSYLAAAAQAPISLVSALGTTQPIFVFAIMVLLSSFRPGILREVMTRKGILQKTMGILAVVTGAVILVS